MSWIPATENDQDTMLKTIGIESVDALFSVIPPHLRMQSWNMPEGLSEMGVRNHLESLAKQNNVAPVCFLGGGYYDHYIPAAVDALSSRSEFYTAYTPYQPECAQGTLQAIYEYQSAICRLTGMEYANASLYDGGTAVFEAATMAVRITRRRRIVVSPGLNPTWRHMLATHTANLDVELTEGEQPDDAACVIVSLPTFSGSLRDYTQLADQCHAAGALLIISFYPIALGLVKTPGEMGADIAVGEGQCLGMPLGFGGPYLGIMATRKTHVRKMPGRIAGETVDNQGRRGFVLTLQAREQHIRRDKAMSNICSNQALCALRALLYLSLMGKEGFSEVASACHAKSEYLKSKLDFAMVLNDGPTFNEFVVRLPKAADAVVESMLKRGYLAGLPLSAVGYGDECDLLVAVTEKRSRDEIDAFVTALEEVACS